MDRGIDKVAITKQITSLDYYISEVKASLENVNTQVSNLKEFYAGDGYQALSGKYVSISENYNALYNRLKAYCEKLEEVISSYEKKDEELAYFATQKIQ